jgi:hypothetical protein
MANEHLTDAKRKKNDEFYTQYPDIEKEMNAYLEYDQGVFRGKTVFLPCDDPEWSNFTRYFAQNFDRLGLHKLISTSFATNSKCYTVPYQPSMFEIEAPQYDERKTRTRGKIFTISKDANDDGQIDINDLEWSYLQGGGDFRSEEIRALRDEADIIITNPPFSLFREFLAWVIEAKKHFSIIGNMNAITYKEVFPVIKANKLWLGATGNGNDMVFAVPEGADIAEKDRQKAARLGYKGDYTRLGNSCWFTSIDHGKRHEPIPLMTLEDNKKYNNKVKNNDVSYLKYENYNAIEVPYTNAIPSDYEGIMGVPISFLDKYSPEQFEIMGMCENEDLYEFKTKIYDANERKQAYIKKFDRKGSYDLNASGVVMKNGLLEKVYQRVLIRHREIN